MCHTDPTGRRAAVAPSALRAGGARGAAPETRWTGRAVSTAKRTRRMRRSSLIDVFWTGIWIWTESFFNHSSLWFILLFIKFKYVKLTLNRLRNNDATKCLLGLHKLQRSFDPSPTRKFTPTFTDTQNNFHPDIINYFILFLLVVCVIFQFFSLTVLF